MDIQAIREILKESTGVKAVDDDIAKRAIIKVFSNDKDLIPDLIEILRIEREGNRDLISDMNLELSRAHIFIDERPESKSEAKQSFNKIPRMNFNIPIVCIFKTTNRTSYVGLRFLPQALIKS